LQGLSQDREEVPRFGEEAEVCDLQVNVAIEIRYVLL
jgi:hypothetical protein